MIQLKDYQTEAKESLTKLMTQYLGKSTMGHQQQIYFEAPTGAGKTVVMQAVMDEFTQSLPSNYECRARQVAYIWVAPNQLHIQSYNRIKLFSEHTRHLHPIYWDDVDHSAGQLNHGDILFVNWESVVHKNAQMTRDTESRDGLLEVVRSTAQEAHILVVLVIDEEHEHTGANATQTRQFLASLHHDLEIRVSATPNYDMARKGFQKVLIDRHRVVDDEMIKKDVVLNPGVKEGLERYGNLGDMALLQMALDKREELKEHYRQAGYPDFNPLLLIQLPNDDKTMNTDDNQVKDSVTAYLADPRRDITVENGRLAVWMSDADDKKNLEHIADHDNMAQVLLFKQAIAKGWDCPRAAVLLIYRKTQSATFTIQTVGRILRMPHQKHYADDMLNHGYVFTDIANDHITIEPSDGDYFCVNYARKVKLEYQLTLTAQTFGTKRVRNRLGSDYAKVLAKTFEDLWQTHQLELTFEEKFNNHGERDQLIAAVRAAAVRHGINLDARRIMTQIPADLTILFDSEGDVAIDQQHRVRMAHTTREVDVMFDVFCSRNVGSFARHDSAPVLKVALLEFMNDYLNFSSQDTKKIILHSDNRARFEAVIAESLRRYDAILRRKVQEAAPQVNCHDWQLPDERKYGDNHVERPSTLHALEPYFELKSASMPERHFRDFLDRQESVLWWYKNGDKGPEHFSIVYTNSEGRQANFYVDYIVRLRNGMIILFDTKSPNGDTESVNKHNALREYIRMQNSQTQHRLDGGIIVEEGGNWIFAQGTIDNMQDKGGWTSLSDFLQSQTHKK